MACVDGLKGEYPELSCLKSIMQTKSSVLVVV